MIDYQKYNDEQLIALLREESPVCDKAFDTIYNNYATKLNSYCLYRSANHLDAEEIFEDTWMKFLARVRAGKNVNKILPFLFSIARSISIDNYRKQNSKKTIGVDYRDINDLDQLVNQHEFETKIENEELISLIKIAVNNLDEKYKETFVLHWFAGMSYKEIGDIIESNTATVKMRASRAMHKVRKMLKPYFIEK